MPYFFVRSSVKFQCHVRQIDNFDRNWAFPKCHSSFNSPKVLKWCTNLIQVLKMCALAFHGQPSNVSHVRIKWPFFTWIERFRPATEVGWTEGFEIMNKAWRGMGRFIVFRCYLSNFKFPWAEISTSCLQLERFRAVTQFELTNVYGMTHIAARSMERFSPALFLYERDSSHIRVKYSVC